MWWDYTRTYSAFSRNFSLISLRGRASAMVIHLHMDGTDVCVSSLTLFPEFQVLVSNLFLEASHGHIETHKSKMNLMTSILKFPSISVFPSQEMAPPFTVTQTRSLGVNLKFSFSSFFLVNFLFWYLTFIPLSPYLMLLQWLRFIISHLGYCNRLQILFFFFCLLSPYLLSKVGQNGGHGLNISLDQTITVM